MKIGLFLWEELIRGDFICGEIRCFRKIGNIFLVHLRTVVFVKLQQIFAFLSSQKFLGAIPSHLTD